MDYDTSISRQIGLFTLQEQAKIQKTTVAVVGLGGTGSMSAILVAKAGFGRIIVVDKDCYELYNVVEQMLATTDTLDVPKAAAAQSVLPKHGPFAQVKAITREVLSLQDAKDVLEGADYLISAVDDPVCRVVLDRAARELGITSIITANLGWKVVVSVHPPTRMSYEQSTQQFSLGKQMTSSTEKALRLQQKVYIASVGDFEADYAERYLRGEAGYISYMAPPAVFGAGVAVSELLKVVTGKGKLAIPPHSIGYDTLKNEAWDPSAIGETVGIVIRTMLTKGMDAGIDEWKQRMGIK